MYDKIIKIIVIVSAYVVVLHDWAAASRINHDEICPRMCTCDLVKGLKRADCSHENLINTNTDVPTSVEILDLSINMISSIENEDFKEYRYMVKLFLSENSIETIALNAFGSLRNLETLDLSHNRLEQLNENWFEFNEKLTDLNLSNNKFWNLADRPMINSPSIAHLNLANCKMPQIYDNLFTRLPNLRALDVSGNLMITLSKEPFNHLRRLRVIHLQENKWQCDNVPVRATVNWMKKRLDTIQIENCFLNPYKMKPKLEKIVLDSNFDSKKLREDIAIEKVWGPTTTADYWASLKEKSCSYSDVQDPENQQTCENFIECQRRYSELYHAYLKGSRLDSDKQAYNQWLSSTILLAGVFIGCIFGSFLTYSIMYLVSICRKPRNNSTKLYTRPHDEIPGRNRNQGQVQRNATTNQHASSNISREDQCQIYQNHENTRQFLVKLFSKRQPRFVRNNSQVANLSNRYMPPTPVRRDYLPPAASPAPTSSSFTWEPVQQNQHNEDLERLLVRPNLEREISSVSAWNDNFRTEEPQRSPSPSIRYEAVPPIYVRASDLNIRQTPPPPYVDCTTRSNRSE